MDAPGGYNLVSDEEYRELLADQRKLYALEAAGVENWEWYNEAMRQFGAEEAALAMQEAGL